MEHVINGSADGDDDAMKAHLDDIVSTYELYAMPGGVVMRTHGPAQCGNYEGGAQEPCTLHNPSEHHMREWPSSFRGDKFGLVERICSHGCGHPDPDSLNFYARNGLSHVGVHGCDGCCMPPTTDIKDVA